MNQGYFNISRKLFDHWLWRSSDPLTKREAWLRIIERANWCDRKFLINDSLIECKRGQCAYSIKEWGKLFNWERQKVRSFFDLLQKIVSLFSG